MNEFFYEIWGIGRLWTVKESIKFEVIWNIFRIPELHDC